MNLVSRFLRTAARHPDRIAVIGEDGRAVSYAALAARSARLAVGWRRAGLRKGDHVLLAMPVGAELFAAMAGLWRLGAVVVFPEPALGLAGLRHAVRTVRPRALLTSGWYRLLRLAGPDMWGIALSLHPSGAGGEEDDDPLMEELPGAHPALVSFTTGSTGAPKAIVRSHAFLEAQDACVAGFLAPEEGRVETDMVAFPVFTVANLGMGVTSVLPGKRLLRKGSPEELRAFMSRHGVTRALVPPSVCETLAAGGAHEGLRAIFTGGGPVFPDLLQRLREHCPQARVIAVYGSTEAEPIAWMDAGSITATDYDAMLSGAGLLAGKPIPQARVKIIDDEIIVTGDHVNKGYLHGRGDAENKLRLDGEIWHRTGDAGRLDAQGRLWLLGRHSAGQDGLWPFMAEAPARAWPGVRRAAFVPAAQGPVLALEGDAAMLPEWRKRARAIGVARVIHIPRMPMDPRHNSKINMRALREMLPETA